MRRFFDSLSLAQNDALKEVHSINQLDKSEFIAFKFQLVEQFQVSKALVILSAGEAGAEELASLSEGGGFTAGEDGGSVLS